MSWFTPQTQITGEEGISTSSPVPPAEKSLALKYLCDYLRPNKYYNILDLGPAVGENIEFFSQYAGKIYIEDLRAAIASQILAAAQPKELVEPADPYALEAADNDGHANITDHLSAYHENTHFDLIFAWDLFNYLEREPLQQLMLYLRKFCKPGTLVFTLISTHVKIPEYPRLFRIIDNERLSYGISAAAERNHARYRELNLLRVMPGFKVAKSFLLRNGIQEYLFIYE